MSGIFGKGTFLSEGTGKNVGRGGIRVGVPKYETYRLCSLCQVYNRLAKLARLGGIDHMCMFKKLSSIL